MIAAMSLQHRGGKFGKIVLKHHPIEGLVRALEPVEALEHVQTVMPGVITSVRGRPIARERGGLVLKVQYIAPDGHIRLLARSGNTTQEVRIICTHSRLVFEKLQLMFGVVKK
jgi:hypothetical protein